MEPGAIEAQEIVEQETEFLEETWFVRLNEMKVLTVAEMVTAEKTADSQGITYAHMMETAGRRVAEAIQQRVAVKDKRVLVLVGPGNNGGDGLVAGRYLAQAGADVAFYLTKPRDPVTDPNYAKILELSLFAVEASLDQRFRVLRTRLNSTDILIDALLGTGVSRPIGGELAKLMKQVQGEVNGEQDSVFSTQYSLPSCPSPSSPLPPRLAPFIVAVDCPSGLNCDTGQLDVAAIPAHLTVTFAGAKRGHFLFPGAAACGELVIADIGIPSDILKAVSVELATPQTARVLLPKRPPDGHKGTFGKVAIAAGSSHYWGAPLLAGRAAYRAGAGLAALIVPSAIRATIAGQLPEATYPPVPDEQILGEASAEMILAMDAKALLVGPGLGDAHRFLEMLLSAGSLPPLVVDADGLNILAGWPDWPRRLPPNTILTPHPGEMARLTMQDIKGVNKDRIELARQKAVVWGHVVVLKGAYTVVAEPNGRSAILPFANPALAVAGSGDVLAGIITSLRAQGMEAYESAVLGAYLHGAAGSHFPGDRGLLAGEIADLLPLALKNLTQEQRRPKADS